jgi:hypothetical protein
MGNNTVEPHCLFVLFTHAKKEVKNASKCRLIDTLIISTYLHSQINLLLVLLLLQIGGGLFRVALLLWRLWGLLLDLHSAVLFFPLVVLLVVERARQDLLLEDLGLMTFNSIKNNPYITIQHHHLPESCR